MTKYGKYKRIKKSKSGPCPFLNTMANHQLIPQDNLRQWDFIQMINKFDFDPFTKKILVYIAVFAIPYKFGFYKSLNDLKDSWIEHDISLSRFDRNTGDFVLFNLTRYKKIRQFSSNDKYLTLNEMIKYKNYLITKYEKDNNKIFDKKILLHGEISLLFIFLSNDNNEIKWEILDDFFIKEKLPTSNKWKPQLNKFWWIFYQVINS